MSEPAVRTFLDLSTSHLREETCTFLDAFEAVVAHRTTHGWLVFVPEEGIAVLTSGGDWPEELLPLIALAQSRGCAYILFDTDAPVVGSLPVFDW